jgi:hypothetical protein
VPVYKCDFFLVPGRDRIDLDEEFDLDRYCPTTSISSNGEGDYSSQSSLDSDFSQKDLQSLLLRDEQLQLLSSKSLPKSEHSIQDIIQMSQGSLAKDTNRV